MKKTFLIIDSNALLHRAFHALPPLKTKTGIETGGVYGFLLTLFKAIKELKPFYIAACFDSKAKTFRHEKFQDYKAQRPVTPPSLVSQIMIIKDVLNAFGIPIFEKDGFEADDLIATLCKICEEEKDLDIYILTGDLDNLQLINEKVKVYTLGRGVNKSIIYDINKVKERFGIEPEKMVDFKALIGDPSDNIPGAKGIGEKIASQLIQKYGSIENLYSKLATDTAILKPRVKEILKKNKETVLLAKELIKMKKDVPLRFELSSCEFGGFNKSEVEEKLKELEFESLLKQLPNLYEQTII